MPEYKKVANITYKGGRCMYETYKVWSENRPFWSLSLYSADTLLSWRICQHLIVAPITKDATDRSDVTAAVRSIARSRGYMSCQGYHTIICYLSYRILPLFPVLPLFSSRRELAPNKYLFISASQNPPQTPQLIPNLPGGRCSSVHPKPPAPPLVHPNPPGGPQQGRLWQAFFP